MANTEMQTIMIAFDVDGTLRANCEERHRTDVEANQRIVELWDTLGRFKNVELHLWSNRGEDYCRSIASQLGLKKCKGFHQKQWRAEQEVEVWGLRRSDIYRARRADAFIPDIAIDDQQRFDGGVLNLIVREK